MKQSLYPKGGFCPGSGENQPLKSGFCLRRGGEASVCWWLGRVIGDYLAHLEGKMARIGADARR